MLQKIKYSIIISLGAFLSFSCDDLLNQQPYSQLSEEQFWKSNADAESGVVAIYDGFQKTYASKYFTWGEFRGDNYQRSFQPPADALEMLNNAITASNGGALRWNAYYNAIGRANIAIENIQKIPSFNKQLLGEAYAARAYLYFHGLRVWGNIPVFTTPIKGLDQELLKPQSSAETVMNDVVIPDMLKAESLMTTLSNSYRFSLNSVYNLQAEVYMFKKEYAKAKVALDKIVATKLYTLVNTREAWQKQFLNDPGQGGKFQTSTEYIFNIKYSQTEDADRGGVFAVFFAGLPGYVISKKLDEKWLDKFPTDSTAWAAKYPTFTSKIKDAAGKTIYGDFRWYDSRELNYSTTALPNPRVAKYTKTNINPTFDDTDILVYRYSNALLLLAEAENQLGNTATAVNLVNQIRTARLLPTVKATEFKSKEDLEDFILDERQMELLAEGTRWWDLVRTGKAVKTMGPINGQTEEKILFPIFDRHLIDNPLLKQNPGY